MTIIYKCELNQDYFKNPTTLGFIESKTIS
jgi:hypothetical protein